MRLLFNSLLVATTISTVSAKSLKDYSPYKYEVLFTNPVCKTYAYDSPIRTRNGEVASKTHGAYCKSGDSRRSTNRKNSPLTRLTEWLKDKNTKEIFMTSLSFSNSKVATELCNAVKRNVKVTLIIDSNNEADTGRMAKARMVSRCEPQNIPSNEVKNYPTVITAGNIGGIGYAHNKLTVINPNSVKTVKLAYASGNISSGLTTHHENWHFVTTSGKSYFVGAHRCLIKGMLDHGKSKSEFKNFIKSCRSKINAVEEDDAKVFFVPGEGKRAYSFITSAIKKAKLVEGAAHRFSNRVLIDALKAKLARDKNTVKFVYDDDVYWTMELRRGTGRNSTYEAKKIKELIKAGMQVHYVETSADAVVDATRMQLHHNKYLIFHFEKGGAIFAGAGNFTNSAFEKNYENFYYISIPEVVQAFKAQYLHMWNNLSKDFLNMPLEYELP